MDSSFKMIKQRACFHVNVYNGDVLYKTSGAILLVAQAIGTAAGSADPALPGVPLTDRRRLVACLLRFWDGVTMQTERRY
jgi:hypothetical protein